MPNYTVKEVVKKTGFSATWLRKHECGECDQMALNTARYGCYRAVGTPCDPIKRLQEYKKWRETGGKK